MATTIAEEWRKASKPHRCIWCGERIELGERYFRWRGVFEGEPMSNEWHAECDKAAKDCKDIDLGDGFDPFMFKRGTVEERP